MKSLIYTYEKELNKPKEWIPKDKVVSILCDCKGDIYMKTIDGRMVRYNNDIESFMREWNEC